MQGNLLEDLNAGVSLRKAAQVRLDNLGQIKNRCTFINDKVRIDRLQHRMELMRLLWRREEIEALQKELDLCTQKDKLAESLPLALKMFSAKETNKRAFTKKSAVAILLIVFGFVPAKNAKKADLLEELNNQDQQHPGKIDEALVDYPIEAVPESQTEEPSAENG